MKPDEIIEGAKEAASQHRIKKVLVKNGTDTTPAEHKHEKVKTVHVTTPGNACYPDMDEESLKNLKKHAMLNRLTIHEFSMDEEAEETEAAGKTGKKK